MLIAGRIVSLLVTIGFGGLLLYASYRVQKGWTPKIRKMAALDAIEEAIGRCAEMGVPAHFTAANADLTTDVAPQTFAGLAVLGYMTRLCARLRVPLIVTIQNPQAIPLHEDIVKQGYLVEGHPEAYNSGYTIRYLSNDQNAHAAGVLSIMRQERCGANVVIGALYGSIYSLLAAGTLSPTGAFTISGTARMTQVPVAVIMSDFSLIGEEMFAAGAYVSKDPRRVGPLVGSDMIKWFEIALLVAGTVLLVFGVKLPTILRM